MKAYQRAVEATRIAKAKEREAMIQCFPIGQGVVYPCGPGEAHVHVTGYGDTGSTLMVSQRKRSRSGEWYWSTPYKIGAKQVSKLSTRRKV